MNTATKTPAIDATISINTDDRVEDPNNTLTLTFANGKVLNVQVGDIPVNVLAQALMHGLKQKCVDAAAISRNPETGKSATVDDKYAAVKAVVDRLCAGMWNIPRGEGTGNGGLLFRALCVMFDGQKSADEVRAWLDGKSEAEQAALRKNPRVADIIERIRPKAKPDASVDTDAMLNELA